MFTPVRELGIIRESIGRIKSGFICLIMGEPPESKH